MRACANHCADAVGLVQAVAPAQLVVQGVEGGLCSNLQFHRGDSGGREDREQSPVEASAGAQEAVNCDAARAPTAAAQRATLPWLP